MSKISLNIFILKVFTTNRSCDGEVQQASSSHIHPKYLLKIFVKIFIQIFDEYFGSHTKFLVAEAVMRKRNELEKLKMLRQDEERRREELVGEKMKIQKS